MSALSAMNENANAYERHLAQLRAGIITRGEFDAYCDWLMDLFLAAAKSNA